MMTSGRLLRTLTLMVLLLTGLSLWAVPPALTVGVPDVHRFGNALLVALEPAVAVMGGRSNAELDGTTTVNAGQKTLVFKPGRREVLVNGKAVDLSAEPFFKNNALYVPLNDLVRQFGGTTEIQGNAVLMNAPGAGSALFPIGGADFTQRPFAEPFLQLYALDTESGNLQRLTYTESPCDFPSFSPDGKLCVYLRDNIICLRAVDTSEEMMSIHGGKQPDGSADTYERPRFSTDGKWICFTRRHVDAGGETTIQAGAMELKVPLGATTPYIGMDLGVMLDKPGYFPAETVDYLPGNFRLTTRMTENKGQVFQLESKQRGPTERRYRDLLVTPNGRWVIFSEPEMNTTTEHTGMRVLSTATGVVKELGAGGLPAMSPDGTLLVFIRSGSRDGQPVSRLAAYHLEGPQAGTLYEFTRTDLYWSAQPGQFTPDGSRIVFFQEKQFGIMCCEVKTADFSLLHSYPVAARENINGRHIGPPCYTAKGDYLLYLLDGALAKAKSDGSTLDILLNNGVEVIRPLPGTRQILFLAAPDKFVRPQQNEHPFGGGGGDFFG